MTARRHHGRVDSRWRAEQRRKHVIEVGLVCMGMPEMDIAPHSVVSIYDLQVHHIVPLHKGGSERGPVRIVCGPCNIEDRNRTYSKKTKSEREHPPVVVPHTIGPLAEM